MNGAEFFMQHAGYRLLPPEHHTEDAVFDAQYLLGLSLPQHTGSTLRLSSCWMVITPDWAATSFKAVPETGFHVGGERTARILEALKSGKPCLILALGKRNLEPRDLFVTYDPRATRICSEGSTRTLDATKEKWWTS
jgi:hypothetical protein